MGLLVLGLAVLSSFGLVIVYGCACQLGCVGRCGFLVMQMFFRILACGGCFFAWGWVVGFLSLWVVCCCGSDCGLVMGVVEFCTMVRGCLCCCASWVGVLD